MLIQPDSKAHSLKTAYFLFTFPHAFQMDGKNRKFSSFNASALSCKLVLVYCCCFSRNQLLGISLVSFYFSGRQLQKYRIFSFVYEFFEQWINSFSTEWVADLGIVQCWRNFLQNVMNIEQLKKHINGLNGFNVISIRL